MAIKQQIVDTTISYLTLRKTLGLLGIFLPLLILIGNGFEIQSSISHFYYTKSSVIFTSILFAFGLFLFSYRGRLKESEKISDNILTNIGGLLAILTALIPTSLCQEATCNYAVIKSKITDLYLQDGITIQYIHNDKLTGIIHLICAAGFLSIMGWMSFYRFTKGNTTSIKKIFYKICGIMVWLSLVILGILIFTDNIGKYGVFIGECVALFFFGISWLVKGKGLKLFGF